MRCPFCHSDQSHVVDSRPTDEGTRRRRECEHCQQRFSTLERVVDVECMVVKRDGRREPFQREKLLQGVSRACAKRPIPHGVLESLAATVETRATQSAIAEVESRTIGEWAYERLLALDAVAAFRFATVLHQPEDLGAVRRALTAAESATPPPATGDGSAPTSSQLPLPGLREPVDKRSRSARRRTPGRARS